MKGRNLDKKKRKKKKPCDDAKKISRLNAPGFNGLVIVWKA